MNAYGLPAGGRVKSRALYGADGQMPKKETGGARTSDTFGTEPHTAAYPKPGEHAISLPSPPSPSGDSPSQTPSRPVGHPNYDRRPHPPMNLPNIGSPGGAGAPRGQGVLGRAKVMLSERLAGRGASPGNHGIEGAPGGNRSYGQSFADRHGEGTRQHSISLPSPTSRPGTSATLRRDIAPEVKPDNRRVGGLNFPFGGGAQGGRGLDRR